MQVKHPETEDKPNDLELDREVQQEDSQAEVVESTSPTSTSEEPVTTVNTKTQREEVWIHM